VLAAGLIRDKLQAPRRCRSRERAATLVDADLAPRTIFDSDVERRYETPALLGEQKYELAGACWHSANPRCRLGRRLFHKPTALVPSNNGLASRRKRTRQESS
jgi:hypothetical protein